MNWASISIFAFSLAIAYYVYQSSKKTAVVPVNNQAPVPEGGIQAIEYFWRPG